MTRGIADEVALDLGLDEAQDEAALRRRVARRLGVAEEDLPALAVLKRAVDARRGRVCFHLVVGPAPQARPLGEPPPRAVDDPRRVLIVGGGPAGLFCAYELARHGIGSTVLERGKQVQPRRRDLRGLHQEGRVDPDSNYCFGEGGAGTYSDGKLYTRSHKRGSVRDVIEILAAHGAPAAILVEARPHIGSNRLPVVVTALREHLESVGVRFVFGARVAALLRDARGAAVGARLADGSELGAEAVVLAVGHSARDVLTHLAESGMTLQAKGFAVGLRIEHPQALINRIQYGRRAGHPALPSAAYQLAHDDGERGVFSFCMCPGGFIVPAATESGGVVVNGMSLSRRDSPFANSGLVVSVEPEDLARAGYGGALGGIDYQRRLEELAAVAGGGALRAPATRVTDFAAGRGSSTVGPSSYQPGLNASDVAEVLDSAGIPLATRLRRALAVFDRRLRGYLSEEAVLVGVESRTSAPVRVPRHPETLQSTEVARLYPCGEGAGYAGGIVSAALDGIRVAEALARALAR
jgi:uncharacterized FAD-dependent dehydrogenase